MLSFNELRYLAHNTKQAEPSYGSQDMDPAVAADRAARATAAQAADEAKSNNRMGYGKAVGMGAGAGALAGIPVALLAHALMADEKKKGLRDYLKSGLLGGLIGGGAGALGGAGLRAAIQADPAIAKLLSGHLESGKSDTLTPEALQHLLGYGIPHPLAARERAGELSIPGVSMADPASRIPGAQNGVLNQMQDAFTGR